MNELHDAEDIADVGAPPARHRTVVHHPEDATGSVVGWSRHHLFDQTVKRRDTLYRLAPAEHLGVVDI
jgi:hypothetical protein